MKLQVPFVQLPLQFDAVRLAAEIAALGESAWKPHPLGYPGNDALSLIAVDGDPASDAIAGAMRPTPALLRCSYLMQALDAIGAVWGRTRLMRLSGHAEVTPHADVSYYWRERLRVHVPILTQPTVRFTCGETVVSMAAGECWIFDTWRIHHVINDATRPRIHLVADTVGGGRFWEHVEQGRVPGRPTSSWHPARIVPSSEANFQLRYETENVPKVMTPWELRQHIEFLLNEALPHPRLPAVKQRATRFILQWQALWSQHGESREGWPEYREALDAFMTEVRDLGAEIIFSNGNTLPFTMAAMVFRVALADRQDNSESEVRAESAAVSSSRAEPRDPIFDRPVFIVSPPRSGSTFLFETLARAPHVFTIGDESHIQIEGMHELHPAARDFDSNRLTAGIATPAIAEALRRRFYESLHDWNGRQPNGYRIRMLEKTPKNALRIPFLARIFPEAMFVYLYRDPRQVLSSMIEAWQSGRFRTYPQLPDWQGLDWSLVLVPGWREHIGKPLAEIVARQWEACTRILLDDLEALPVYRRTAVHYGALLETPEESFATLFATVDFDAAVSGDALQIQSRYTLSAPDPEKWRRHQREIETMWPLVKATALRAERVAADFMH